MVENITGYTARKLGYEAFEIFGMTLGGSKVPHKSGFSGNLAKEVDSSRTVWPL